MKKNVIIIVVAALVAGLAFWLAGKYNAMVTAEENVTTAWSQVENQYQRRSDLIPNLVATVKGYAEHESQVFENVTEARARATQMTLSEDATPEQLAAFQAAQGELSQALGRLLALAENYPNLKANENFRDLQVQLEGTENRINDTRNKFNEAVQNYNVVIRSFPKNLLAGMFGFEKMDKFEAEAGAEKAPQVKF